MTDHPVTAAIQQVRAVLHGEVRAPHVEAFFDEPTFTVTYVVSDAAAKKAAIIDSVWNFDQASGRTSFEAADEVVAYVEREGAYYLAATAGGQPKEPQWVRNLRAASTATIEIGRERRTVSVEVLRGAENDAAWRDVIVATYPAFAPYEAKSGRKIAVARLTPTA